MKYETKDSGERQEFESGMRRDVQSDKPRFDLCLPAGIPFEEQLLTRFARLMERGAKKYGCRNFEKASSFEELDRFKSSAFRHFMEWFCDVQDGEDHAAAVLFNLTAHESTRYKMSQPVRCEVKYSQVETAFPTVEVEWCEHGEVYRDKALQYPEVRGADPTPVEWYAPVQRTGICPICKRAVRGWEVDNG